MLTHARFTHMALITLLVGGCGGGAAQDAPRTAAAGGKPAESAIEVCALLTAEEIASVTGARVADIKPDGFGTVGTCNYSVPNEPLPVVSLVLAPNMPDVATSAEMARWRSQQAGTSYGDLKIIITPIEGLGVPAIRNEVEGMGLVTVEAAAKGMLVDVTTSSLDMSKALMPKALARLP
jgi:hypothetical protein